MAVIGFNSNANGSAEFKITAGRFLSLWFPAGPDIHQFKVGGIGNSVIAIANIGGPTLCVLEFQDNTTSAENCQIVGTSHDSFISFDPASRDVNHTKWAFKIGGSGKHEGWWEAGIS